MRETFLVVYMQAHSQQEGGSLQRIPEASVNINQQTCSITSFACCSHLSSPSTVYRTFSSLARGPLRGSASDTDYSTEGPHPLLICKGHERKHLDPIMDRRTGPVMVPIRSISTLNILHPSLNPRPSIHRRTLTSSKVGIDLHFRAGNARQDRC